MIRIKKAIFIIIITLCCLTKSNATIKDSIFATVGNKAITRSDIINEIKIILIVNSKSFSQEMKDQIEQVAIQSVIKRNVKKVEIEKYTLKYDPVDVERELIRMASSIDIDVISFKNIFAANEIDFSIILDQIKTELLWNSLIFKIYKDRLSINLDEINEQLKLIQNKEEIEEFLISEIIIKSVPQDSLESKIQELKDRINQDGFEKVALELSISETAIKGGDLGWVGENEISKELKSKIIDTPVGSISEPIFLPEGILLFKVRNKRKQKKILDLEKAKNNLINAEKGKILKMYSLSHYDNLRRSISINYFK